MDGPIEINRDSWHGRLTRYVFGQDHIIDTPSICPYFWSVWVAVIFAPLKYTVSHVEDWGHWKKVGLGLFCLAIGIGAYFDGKATIYWTLYAFGNFVGAQVIWWVGNWYRAKHPYRPSQKVPQIKTKKRSWVASYWKARKDRVCPPIIEVRDA